MATAVLSIVLFFLSAAPRTIAHSACSAQPDPAEAKTTAPEKRPWLSTLEVVGINAGVWACDRYVFKHDFSYVSWKTWKANLRAGFAYDADPFFENFIAHPYHGSLYFSAARSHGLSFWESAPFALGGSLMWEMFGENTPPSINDAILTTTGGIFLGETLYRLSSQVLDDSAGGGNRFWREVVAGIIDPIRGLNRVLSGEAWRVRAARGQTREPIHGNLAFSAKLVSENLDLSHLRSSPGLEFDMIYGESSKDIESRSPMDLIILNSSVRAFDKKVLFDFNAYGLWFGRQYSDHRGRKHLFGLFQNFDYLKNELTHMGGTSLTGGLISLFPLGKKFELNTSLQLGPMAFGASNNRYTLIEQRDYNYGAGAVGKLDGWLTHPALGTLAISVDHFQVYTFRGAALAADLSHDFFTVFKTSYTFPLRDHIRLRLEYAIYNRHLHFNGQSAYDTSESLAGASLAYRF